MRLEKRTFESEVAFLDWKIETESSTVSHFVKHRGSHNSEAGKKDMLYCFRTERTSDLPFKCTSFIKVTHHLKKYFVEACLAHYGHDPTEDLPRHPLPFAFREQIAHRLKLHVPPRRVAIDMRTEACNEWRRSGKKSREMYVTLQDVHNIRKEFLPEYQFGSLSDMESLRAEFVCQQTLPERERTLLFVKTETEAIEGYPELTDTHFVAVIQNDHQRQALQRHGSSGICIDATHCVTRYKKIYLVTLMVLDDSERGVPVAHCLVNHEDTPSMELFFITLLPQLRSLTVLWFLSDDAPAFYNAWLKVVRGETKKLLCIWHVLKNVNAGIQIRTMPNAAVAQNLKFLFRAVMYSHTEEACADAVRDLRQALMSAGECSGIFGKYLFESCWAVGFSGPPRMSHVY
ncbi:hypothetical protein BV898_00652 [Hypsibius exemplaris]|uniref:MULE transposase domain-containing protein n=1 Tax=Hypsibius exemplaris TaxID=2072580 RepID=A0A1W0XED2_HYPEX|nr:hypothetical protein BV898_00652 [Hypsibius exemplaris]